MQAHGRNCDDLFKLQYDERGRDEVLQQLRGAAGDCVARSADDATADDATADDATADAARKQSASPAAFDSRVSVVSADVLTVGRIFCDSRSRFGRSGFRQRRSKRGSLADEGFRYGSFG